MKIQDNTTDILLPPEAAYVLGITQELLFSYTRVAAKKNDENNVRLKHTVKNGNICFLRSELIQFDTYLHEPWSATAEERPKIPTFIETFLGIEGGGQCARCGKGHKVTSAHISPYAETRSHHHHNLIRLCTGCHSEYDDGLIDRAEIKRLKEELIGKTRQRLLASAPNGQRSLGRVPNAAALFVGRGEDVKTLTAMLRENRSVSVEGAAGIGKTGAEAAVRLGQPQRASNLLVQAFCLARRSHNPETEAAASSELAKLADGATNHEILANASMAQGCLATEAHQWDQALAHFESAEHYYACGPEESDSAELDDSNGRQLSNNNLTMVLMEKARIYEKTNRPLHALPILERALDLVRKSNDEVNIGSILHHIGNCAADCTQPERALEAFLAAAEQFRKIGMAEYLSTALSEMGYLLVEWDPPKPIIDFLAEDLLEDALQDLSNQIAFTFSKARNATQTARMDVIRKTFGMTALSSFSCSHLLGEWAAQLTEDVLRPSLGKLDEGPMDEVSKIQWMHLDLTLALARTLAQVPAEGDPRRALTEAEIKHYAWLCYKFFDWGWEAFHPFEWLSTYLRRHRGSTSHSASSLRAAAIAEAERRESI